MSRVFMFVSATEGSDLAIEQVLRDRVQFSVVSTTLPGVVRRYKSLTQAAWENGLSRVYGGIHFQHAVDDGFRQGKGIGRSVSQLLPRVQH